MRYENNKVYDIKIAYIGGGSRGWAWGLMADLALENSINGEISLYDIDKQRALDNQELGNRISSSPESKSQWKYKAVDTLKEALTGADFVIASILPATFDEMESDVHAPEEYGIYQSVGDTAGPGGILRAMRTLPIYENLALNIKQYCPKAWVINYTNPMTLCVRVMYAVFPEIRAFGCCHEVFGTQTILADMVKELTGDKKVTRDDIVTTVLGVNHFTWINKATYHGQDLIPLYSEFCNKYADIGWSSGEPENWLNKYFNSKQRVKMDLFKRFGVIAAAGDRHLAEFLPQWYLQSPEMALSWDFTLTPVSWRKEHDAYLREKSRKLLAHKEEIEIKSSGEEGIRQIKALLGLEEFVTNVNIPNKGQMADVPLNAVVETNAFFRDGEIVPAISGSLPPAVQNLVIRHVYTHETFIKGYLEHNKEELFRAFRNDPAMKTITEKDCRTLFAKMINNTKDYLPDWMK